MRPMNAFSDAWNHAQTVRSCMTQALQDLGPANANVADAAAALHRARLAWNEVAFSIGKAGQSTPPAPAALNESFFFPRPSDERHVDAKREALALDLVQVDRMIDWLDARAQRARA